MFFAVACGSAEVACSAGCILDPGSYFGFGLSLVRILCEIVVQVMLDVAL
jgi:hypothetical protein